jgi:hypothetical protein
LSLSKKETNYYLPDISMTTIENVLSGMVKNGKIKKMEILKMLNI